MAATFSLFDVGGCNCPSCGGAPCALPPTNLTVTRTQPGPISHSATLIYSLVSGCCKWQGCITNSGVDLDLITIYSTQLCTGFSFAAAGSGSCASPTLWETYLSPGGCTPCGTFPGTTFSGSMTLTSFSCSPLNIVLTIASGAFTLTITP